MPGKIWNFINSCKLLKRLEPAKGIEPPTYALRMGIDALKRDAIAGKYRNRTAEALLRAAKQGNASSQSFLGLDLCTTQVKGYRKAILRPIFSKAW